MITPGRLLSFIADYWAAAAARQSSLSRLPWLTSSSIDMFLKNWSHLEPWSRLKEGWPWSSCVVTHRSFRFSSSPLLYTHSNACHLCRQNRFCRLFVFIQWLRPAHVTRQYLLLELVNQLLANDSSTYCFLQIESCQLVQLLAIEILAIYLCIYYERARP